MLKSLAIGLTVGFTATAALAQAQAQGIPRPLGVWDSKGEFVGDLIQQGVVGFKGAALSFRYEGINEGAALLFTAPNCGGSPYGGVDPSPALAGVHNGQAFIPGHPAQIAAASILYYPGGSCANFPSPENTWAAPVTPTPVSGFVPPLCVSATKVICK